MFKDSMKRVISEMNSEVLEETLDALCDKQLEKEMTNMKTVKFKKRIILIFAAAFVIAAVMIPLGVMMSKNPGQVNPLTPETNTTTKQLYKCLVCGNDNDLSTELEASWWQGYYSREDAEKEKSVEFEGIEYSGKYSVTDTPATKFYQIDKYTDSANKADLYFFSESGRFAGLHYGNLITEGYANKKDLSNAYNYAVEEAKRIARQFIDVDEYELFVSEKKTKSCVLYSIEFVKMINGYHTSDCVTVVITSKGDLRTLRLGDIELFNNTVVPSIDEEKLYKSIENKLQTIFNTDSPEFSVRKSVLTKSADGDIVIAAEIEVSLTKEVKTLVLIAAIIA